MAFRFVLKLNTLVNGLHIFKIGKYVNSVLTDAVEIEKKNNKKYSKFFMISTPFLKITKLYLLLMSNIAALIIAIWVE
jgi:hypothetical protein